MMKTFRRFGSYARYIASALAAIAFGVLAQ